MSNNDFREIIDDETVLDQIISGNETKLSGEENTQTVVEDDEVDYEDICYICRRPESVTGKMVTILQKVIP